MPAPPKGLSTSGNAEQNRPYLLGLGLGCRLGVGLGLWVLGLRLGLGFR